MNKFLVALCCTLSFMLPSAHAQNAAPVDPAAAAAVKDLLVSMNYRELITKSFSELEKNMPAIMLQGATMAINGNARLDAEHKKAAIDEVSRQIPAMAAAFSATLHDEQMMDELFAEMTPLYARRFSVDEIKQIAAFYKTPVGLKMLALTPELISESTQISQRVVSPRVAAVVAKLTQGKK